MKTHEVVIVSNSETTSRFVGDLTGKEAVESRVQLLMGCRSVHGQDKCESRVVVAGGRRYSLVFVNLGKS